MNTVQLMRFNIMLVDEGDKKGQRSRRLSCCDKKNLAERIGVGKMDCGIYREAKVVLSFNNVNITVFLAIIGN